MSEYLNKQAVLEWLKEESTNTSYERIVRDTLTTTLLKIQSGRFDVPEQQVNYSEQDIQTALTRELTDDRVAIAAAYWLDASPHERWVPDGIILARYARHAIAEIDRLRAALEWYGQEKNYVVPHIGCTSKVMIDCGAKARQALSTTTEPTGAERVREYYHKLEELRNRTKYRDAAIEYEQRMTDICNVLDFLGITIPGINAPKKEGRTE